MARYIDADKIDFRLPYFTDENGDALVSLKTVKRCIAMTPTEDVVPKSEVAREILHDLNTAIHNKAVYPNCQGDYAFVNLKVFVGVLQNIQKKYTEGGE